MILIRTELVWCGENEFPTKLQPSEEAYNTGNRIQNKHRERGLCNRQSKILVYYLPLESAIEQKNRTMIQKGKRNGIYQHPRTPRLTLALLLLQCLLFPSVCATLHAGAEGMDTSNHLANDGILINFDFDISNLIPGNGICLNRLIDAQEQNSKLFGNDSGRGLQLEEGETEIEDDEVEGEEEEDEDLVNDDAIAQILFNENFAKCNDQTKQFYEENPHIEAVVREFGASASVMWDGPDDVNLKLEFNRTMKDIMKETCLNNGNVNPNITSSAESGKYAFAGNLNCTYKLEGGATANTTIVNYANCVANTTACQEVDETEFLQIVMHSFGSACSGFKRESTLLSLGFGTKSLCAV